MKVFGKATALLIQLFLVGFLVSPATAKTFVYISCADDGEIASMEMNLENGDMRMIGKIKAGKVVMPMTVSPDRRFLHAAIRSVPRQFASYSIDSTKGELTHYSTVPSPDNMVNITTDKTGRFLLAASYTGHIISVNPIGDKGFVQAEPAQVMNTGRHPHSIVMDPSNRFVYVPNLGSDEVSLLKFDEKTGLLISNNPASLKTKANSGPKLIVFSPNNRFAYLLHQLDGTLNAYSFDSQAGLLNEIQSVSVVPRNADLVLGKVNAGIGAVPSAPQPTQAAPEASKPQIHSGDLHITPDGKFLYASEETTSTLAAFAIDSDTGGMRYINSYATETQPRGFNIDPRGNFILAAGQKSDHLQVHKINRQTGELLLVKRHFVGKNPNWIEIVDFP